MQLHFSSFVKTKNEYNLLWVLKFMDHSLCTSYACIIDEPSIGLRISIKRWMQNLHSFTHKKINKRKKTLKVWWSWDFLILRNVVLSQHIFKWDHGKNDCNHHRPNEHYSFLDCFKSWTCYCTTKAMMHACADFIWIENVYQNLQNKFALKEP